MTVISQSLKSQIKESSKTNPVSNYARNKKKAENLCLNYSNKYNFDLLILRVASIYGEGLEKQFIHDACQKISNIKNTFSRIWRGCIYIWVQMWSNNFFNIFRIS